MGGLPALPGAAQETDRLVVLPETAETVGLVGASGGSSTSVMGMVTVGDASSSMISTVAPVTEKPGTVVVPATDTVSSGSSTVSCVGLRLNVPVCDRVLGGMMIVNPATAAKSVPDSAVPDPTVTATGVASPRVPPFRPAVTVTVVAFAPSLTDSGTTVRVTPLDAVSSSSTVTSTEAAVTLP